jgi:hypothetical protein
MIALEQKADFANLAGLQPVAEFYYELDCSAQMARRLSTHLRVRGQDHFDPKASIWGYTPPESNGARLLKILCAK